MAIAAFLLPLRMLSTGDQQGRQLVDVAAGKRHTLFVSDDGLAFSVGEGLHWQLGTISMFSNHPVPRAAQRLPKQVRAIPIIAHKGWMYIQSVLLPALTVWYWRRR